MDDIEFHTTVTAEQEWLEDIADTIEAEEVYNEQQ